MHPRPSSSRSAGPSTSSNTAATSGTSETLNEAELRAMLEEASQYLPKTSITEPTVLLLGQIGGGKTTLFKYLLRQQLWMDALGHICGIEGDVGDIGHGAAEKTLYPVTGSCRHLPFQVTDLPGWGGQTNPTRRAIETICTELTVQKASNILGSILTLSLGEMTEARSPKFLSTMQILQNLFQKYEFMLWRTCIGITKCDDFADLLPARVNQKKELIKQNIKNSLAFCLEQQLTLGTQRSPQGLFAADYAQMQYGLVQLLVLWEENAVVFINPLDEGQSRAQIVDCLQGHRKSHDYYIDRANAVIEGLKQEISSGTLEMRVDKASAIRLLKPFPVSEQEDLNKPADASYFNFHDFDEYRRSFSNIIYSWAREAKVQMKKLSELYNEYKENERNIQDNLSQIDNQKKLVGNVQSCVTEEQKSKCDEDEKKTIEKDIKSIKNKIKRVDRRITGKNKSIRRREKEIRNLSTSEIPIIYEPGKKKRELSQSLLMRWSYIAEKFEIYANDKKIVKLQLTPNDKSVKWVNEDYKNERKSASIVFQTERFVAKTKATVTPFIQKKDHPDTLGRINELNDQIEKLREAITKLENEKNKLTVKKQKLVANLTQVNTKIGNNEDIIKEKNKLINDLIDENGEYSVRNTQILIEMQALFTALNSIIKRVELITWLRDNITFNLPEILDDFLKTNVSYRENISLYYDLLSEHGFTSTHQEVPPGPSSQADTSVSSSSNDTTFSASSSHSGAPSDCSPQPSFAAGMFPPAASMTTISAEKLAELRQKYNAPNNESSLRRAARGVVGSAKDTTMTRHLRDLVVLIRGQIRITLDKELTSAILERIQGIPNLQDITAFLTQRLQRFDAGVPSMSAPSVSRS